MNWFSLLVDVETISGGDFDEEESASQGFCDVDFGDLQSKT